MSNRVSLTSSRSGAVEQVVARGAVRALTEPGRRIRLRVQVDDERRLAGLGQARSEVDGRRRLADAALLVRDRVDARHAPRLLTPTDVSSPRPGAAGNPRESARPSGSRARRLAAPAAAADLLGDVSDRVAIGAGPDEQHDRAAVAYERQTPLGRDRRLRECTRNGDPVGVRGLLFRASAHDAHVREPRGEARQRRAFRSCASSKVTSRSGNAAASGIPGEPPPEPTSTIGPSYSATIASTSSDRSTCSRQAVSGWSIAVRPGVATSSSTQRRRRSSAWRLGSNDDVAVRLGARALGGDAAKVLQP